MERKNELSPEAPAPAPEAASDRRLVAALRQGDARSGELLMRRYNRRLFRAARSILGDEAEAEDVVQETYVRAFTRIGDFRGPAGFGAWLCRIACNEALDRARRAGRLYLTEAPEDEAPERSLTRPSADPVEFAARREFAQFLEAAVDALPDGFRAVFMLRAIEQLSVAETATCLDLNQQTVKTRYHRARHLLQASILERVDATLDELYPFAGARCDRIVATVLQRLCLARH